MAREGPAGVVSTGSLVRWALAMQSSNVLTDPEPEELDRARCLRLIGPRGVGRIIFEEALLPVGYAVRPQAVFLRSLHAGAADTAILTVGNILILQVDSIDPHRLHGWNVVIRGPARRLGADGLRDLHLELVPEQITGRMVYEPPLF